MTEHQGARRRGLGTNHYETLSLRCDATAEQVRSGYDRSCLRLRGDVAEREKRAAVDRAYQVLGDPVLRAEYDATLPAGDDPSARSASPDGSGDSSGGDEPSGVGGQREAARPKGADRTAEPPLTPQQARDGGRFVLPADLVRRPCPYCTGSGSVLVKGRRQACSTCGGGGSVADYLLAPLRIVVPPGSEFGATISVVGEGRRAAAVGGRPGDLVLTLTESQPRPPRSGRWRSLLLPTLVAVLVALCLVGACIRLT